MPEQVLEKRIYVYNGPHIYLSSGHHPPGNHLVPLLDSTLARFCFVFLSVGQVLGEEPDVSPICCSRILVIGDFMAKIEACWGMDFCKFVAKGGGLVDI